MITLLQNWFGKKTEKIRIFKPENLTIAVKKQTKDTSQYRIAKRSGFTPITISRWMDGKKTNCFGSSQERLHRYFGDSLFTHGLDIKKFRARMKQESIKHGSRKRAAEVFGVGYKCFCAWLACGCVPKMGFHQQIYAVYGSSVFKKMGDEMEEKKTIKNIISEAEYKEMMKSAKQGMWHGALCKYGFCSPTVDKYGKPVLPVNLAFRDCNPKRDKDGNFTGIWKQIHELALQFNDKRPARGGKKHTSPEFRFVDRATVGYKEAKNG